jgi:phosphatidylinositol kinase/protein kinase (PI-3  family)
MLDNDPEASKRNLRLRTFSIVPLSRNTGMIEWINNTNTLKNVVSDYWKKQNVKGEMTDIKKKAQEMQMGDTHTKIWKTVM